VVSIPKSANAVRSTDAASSEPSQIDVIVAVVGDASAYRDDQAVVLAIRIDAQARPLGVHGRGLVLDAEELDLGLDADDRRMADVARAHAHAVGVAIENQRALAFACVVGFVATCVKMRIGVQVAFDALNTVCRQRACDLGDVARRQRRIAAAAQDDVAVNHAVGVGLGSVERGVIAKVGAEQRHRGGRGEHLGVRRRVELYGRVVREQHVAVRGLHHLDADLGATERRVVQHRHQAVA